MRRVEIARSRDSVCRSQFPQHDGEVPRHQLSDHGNTEHPPHPPRKITWNTLDDGRVDLRVGPAQASRGGHGKQGLAENVFGRMPMLALVTASRPVASEVVPGRGLVPTPWTPPQGVR